MSKPTILLVPGAWHTPQHYGALLESLEEAGYSTLSGGLPSVGALDPRDKDVATDAAYVRELLMPELERGSEVLLVMHSYGGIPGAAAAKGLSISERRADGKRGGVVGLLFISAFVMNEGDSMVKPGDEPAPWAVLNKSTGYLDVDGPEHVFYNGATEEQAAQAIAGMEQQAFTTLITPSPSPAWPDKEFNGRRGYIKCHLDNAIPVAGQEAMLQYSGVEWKVLSLEDAGHAPFLTHVDQITKFVEEILR